MASMHKLIKNGDLAGVQRAVQNDPALLDAAVTANKHTPLMWALHSDSGGHPAIAQWLVEQGANLDLQDDEGWTALMTACRYEQPDTAQLLIKRGAKLDLQKNNDGWTALIIACRYDQPDTAQLLIQRGAKLDLQTNDGWTALMLACSYDQPDTAQLLIERGAKLDLQNKEGNTALMLVCQQPSETSSHHTVWGLLRCIKLCYGAGADLNWKNKSGRDALVLAKMYERAGAVAFLEFAAMLEVARGMQGRSQQPRSVVAASLLSQE